MFRWGGWFRVYEISTLSDAPPGGVGRNFGGRKRVQYSYERRRRRKRVCYQFVLSPQTALHRSGSSVTGYWHLWRRVGAALIAAITVKRKEKGIFPDRWRKLSRDGERVLLVGFAILGFPAEIGFTSYTSIETLKCTWFEWTRKFERGMMRNYITRLSPISTIGVIAPFWRNSHSKYPYWSYFARLTSPLVDLQSFFI